MGNNVTSIGRNAFSSCGSLNSIKIPNSVTDVGMEDDCTHGSFFKSRLANECVGCLTGLLCFTPFQR